MTKRKRLRPFFSYYGSKWSIIKKYPHPIEDTIIEPFAGSASYALAYPNKKIILNDIDKNVFRIWKYLIRVSEKEILSLPDMSPDMSIHDLKEVCEEARILIGYWLGRGRARPCTKPGTWMKKEDYKSQVLYWGLGAKKRISSQLQFIRHWKITNSSYCRLENKRATYFIDPPYYKGGKHYTHHKINYHKLSLWCQTRAGQAIVCENQHGNWLQFKALTQLQGTTKKTVEHIFHKITK